MNTEFLFPFIALLVCFGWISSANTQCERNYDYVHFYNTGLFQMVILAIAVCLLAGLIISWVNAGFLIFLAYLWKNRGMMGQHAGGRWDTFDVAKLMIFS